MDALIAEVLTQRAIAQPVREHGHRAREALAELMTIRRQRNPGAGHDRSSQIALTTRELEVLRLLSAGMSNREAAQELCVALSTVKTHLNHIYDKLGVRRRTQAIARARELKLL